MDYNIYLENWKINITYMIYETKLHMIKIKHINLFYWINNFEQQKMKQILGNAAFNGYLSISIENKIIISN